MVGGKALAGDQFGGEIWEEEDASKGITAIM